jgi:hypothetical protein
MELNMLADLPESDVVTITRTPGSASLCRILESLYHGCMASGVEYKRPTNLDELVGYVALGIDLEQARMDAESAFVVANQQFTRTAHEFLETHSVLSELHCGYYHIGDDESADSAYAGIDTESLRDGVVVAAVGSVLESDVSRISLPNAKHYGCVYVLDLPGGVKVGRTSAIGTRLIAHMRSARDLGVPLYRVAFTEYNFDHKQLESEIHKELESYRIAGSEFFAVSFCTAVAVISGMQWRTEPVRDDMDIKDPTERAPYMATRPNGTLCVRNKHSFDSHRFTAVDILESTVADIFAPQ